MRILFMNAKKYDTIWFEQVAKEKGFCVSYTEQGIDTTSMEDMKGYHVICTNNITEITGEIEKRLAVAGIRAILYRGNDRISYSGRLPIIQIASFKAEDITSRRWQSYLP